MHQVNGKWRLSDPLGFETPEPTEIKKWRNSLRRVGDSRAKIGLRRVGRLGTA